MNAPAPRLKLLSTALALGVLNGYAQPTNSVEPILLRESGSSAFAVVRMLGAMAIVLALFFAGLWLFRNWQRLAGRHGRAPRLTVIEARSLGQRHTLYVIGYEQQRMLVAASPAGVSMLSSLPDGLPVAQPIERSAPAPALPQFGLLLQGLLRKS
jgi:flagellar biogenesis protein FliO